MEFTRHHEMFTNSISFYNQISLSNDSSLLSEKTLITLHLPLHTNITYIFVVS